MINRASEIRKKLPYEFKAEHDRLFNVQLPKDPDIPGDEAEFLESLCAEGLIRRYGNDPAEEVRVRLRKELDAIRERGDRVRTFLLCRDITKFLRENGYEVGKGWGRDAGCLINYCLGITEIDPVRYGLLFELYYNQLRTSRPYIEFDVCRDGKDAVVRYLKDKYGRNHVAFSSSYDIQENNTNETVIKRYVNPSAVILTERPSGEYAKITEIGGESCFVYDCPDLEEMGLHLLYFREMPVLARIRNLKKKARLNGKDASFEDSTFNDQKVFDLMNSENTDGLYLLGNNGLLNVVRAIRGSTVDELASALAMYNLKGWVDHLFPDYCNAKFYPEKRRSFLAGFTSSLDCTYGVLLYKEQIVELLSRITGCSMEYADLWRRRFARCYGQGDVSVSRKAQELEILVHGNGKDDENGYFDGCLVHGISREQAEQIMEALIEGSMNLHFKAYWLSQAALAYEVAWYKLNFPEEFEKAFILPEFSGENYEDIL